MHLSSALRPGREAGALTERNRLGIACSPLPAERRLEGVARLRAEQTGVLVCIQRAWIEEFDLLLTQNTADGLGNVVGSTRVISHE